MLDSINDEKIRIIEFIDSHPNYYNFQDENILNKRLNELSYEGLIKILQDLVAFGYIPKQDIIDSSLGYIIQHNKDIYN